MSLAQANREVYKLLKDGVRVSFQDDDGGEANETLRVIDWNEPENNDFFLASQFWVTGSIYKRRGDLIGFVNGLPLIFIELKKTPQQGSNTPTRTTSRTTRTRSRNSSGTTPSSSSPTAARRRSAA